MKCAASVLIWGSLAASGTAAPPAAVTAYEIHSRPAANIRYQGWFSNQFPHGFPVSLGSAITLKRSRANGTLEFYGLSDRGPNADGPQYAAADGRLYGAKIFPTPGFTPSIGRITIDPQNGAVVRELIPLKNGHGKLISGRPIAAGQIGATSEVGLDDYLQPLPYDEDGLDPEGMARDRSGGFWVSDEYGPFIVHFDPNGVQTAKYGPGTGLPEILKWRIPNRGFEGLTITPGGKLLAAVQSVLDIDGRSAKTARFIRIVELDPATGATRMFGYPIDDVYKRPKDAKIGDIFALSETRLLVIEQGSAADGKLRHLIYTVDLSGTTDLTGRTVEGKEPEFARDIGQLRKAGITLAGKSPLLDLRALGWKPEKAEGMCMLSDMHTIVLVNDNDFGVMTEAQNGTAGLVDIADYVLRSDNVMLDRKGVQANIGIKLVPNHESSMLWLVRLASPLTP